MFRYENIPDPQTRLDRYVENKHIEILSPDTIDFLFGFNKIIARQEILRWKERHEGNYFCLDPARPEVIKVTLTDHDTDVHNKIVHNKNNRRNKHGKK